VNEHPNKQRDRDALNRYRQSTAPPLTLEEELALGRQIRDTSLPESERRRARDLLVEGTRHRVPDHVRRFYDLGLPVEELLALGDAGLLEATDVYDPSRGFRFETIAQFYIRREIRFALTRFTRTVRIPQHAYEALTAGRELQDQLQQQRHREVRDDEIAERLGSGLYIDALNADAEPIPYDPPEDSDDDDLTETLHENPLAHEFPAPDGLVMEHEEREVLERVLTERQLETWDLYFGIYPPGGRYTNDELRASDGNYTKTGELLGITRQTVQESLAASWRKLRLAQGEPMPKIETDDDIEERTA
jgi:RNA polymerase primary sigma factor